MQGVLPSGLFQRKGQKPFLLALLIPISIFLLACSYARSHFYRDPTSQFFDPARAYQQLYSSARRQEAEIFVNTSSTKPFLRKSPYPPLLCIGMLTIARPSGDVYFSASIGSLLAGLTQFERDAIYLVPFIGHTNASKHPSYTEPWLHNIADRVLTYNTSKFTSEEQYIHIQELERERERTGVPDREKHMYDYVQLLKQCDSVEAKYVAIIEDDALALDGWFHRTRKGLEEIERRTQGKGEKGFFYLRIFYTEGLLGWNRDEWPKYMSWVLLVILISLLINAIGFRLLRRRAYTQKHGQVLLLASLLVVGFSTIFFFLAGRVSMMPLPMGVHEMSKYGCCAQAIVYPRNKVAMLASWYEQKRIGFVDTLAEEFADKKPDVAGVRWALTPSVAQHIGGRSSKGDAQWDGKVKYIDGKTTGETLFNFAFELNDPAQLRNEHIFEASSWERHSKSSRNKT